MRALPCARMHWFGTGGHSTLLFAYLQVERNIEWFRRVLQLSLGGAELRVNARNCVGTVLALNPHRNYFYGLENWLDRLFEGSTHRYYINYWPDMTTK
ncbi:hypothetical protein MSG28_003691 [Choristoneura fumiferana]|uniref:Uncharacterized protein n=1 Tax=Choristoneura fumiferana TaxID=7141 RepID=A0ACC0KG31_CHOFU|nr:hypothetical protein MSG28_003691 [Choristoneura fumiferana]